MYLYEVGTQSSVLINQVSLYISEVSVLERFHCSFHVL